MYFRKGMHLQESVYGVDKEAAIEKTLKSHGVRRESVDNIVVVLGDDLYDHTLK